MASTGTLLPSNHTTSGPSLLSLPPDTLLRICSYLPGHEVAKLQIALSSKVFVQVTRDLLQKIKIPSDAVLWKTAFYRDFGRHCSPPIYIHNGVIDWKHAYGEKFRTSSKNRKFLRENFIKDGNMWRFPRTTAEVQWLKANSSRKRFEKAQ
eukprot:jgi/Galph1/2783/GphlegSOOS_G1458.1